MKLMAIDLSTKSTGIAVFENKKLIKWYNPTASSTDIIDRILKITAAVRDAVSEHPDIEKLYLEEVRPDGMNAHTGKMLMYAQAALVIMMHENFPKVKIEFVVPGTWRKSCGIKTGKGIKREELKKKDILFVLDNFKIEVNDDVADAIGIGYHASLQEEKEDGFDWT